MWRITDRTIQLQGPRSSKHCKYLHSQEIERNKRHDKDYPMISNISSRFLTLELDNMIYQYLVLAWCALVGAGLHRVIKQSRSIIQQRNMRLHTACKLSSLVNSTPYQVSSRETSHALLRGKELNVRSWESNCKDKLTINNKQS